MGVLRNTWAEQVWNAAEPRFHRTAGFVVRTVKRQSVSRQRIYRAPNSGPEPRLACHRALMTTSRSS